MPGQEQIRPQQRDRDPGIPEDAGAPPAPGGAAVSESIADIDSVLDEIDGVLEANAEEFVKGFVQKGGQ